MAWQLYRVTYELLSPLHIGCHKIGNLQRTRYYIPARNLWGAVTERLTRGGFGAQVLRTAPDDYAAVGDWVKTHCAFSYFFLCDGGCLLYPRYTSQGLLYGSLPETKLERRWLSAHATTALDAATTSAMYGSLHEVEFIAPHDSGGCRTVFSGWIFWDEEALRYFPKQWGQWLAELQVGGERRYGFGRLRLRGEPQEVAKLGVYEVSLMSHRPSIRVQKQIADEPQPLLAHVPVEDVAARGMIEPLVGRETSGDSQRFGQMLTSAQMSWVPGSVLEEDQAFILAESGMWRKDSTIEAC